MFIDLCTIWSYLFSASPASTESERIERDPLMLNAYTFLVLNHEFSGVGCGCAIPPCIDNMHDKMEFGPLQILMLK